MTFSIIWHPKVQKALRKLPKELAQRIVEKVGKLREEPFSYLEHYEGKDYYKLRIGNYRLLIEVDMDEKTLLIQILGHRKNVYKR